MRDRLTPCAYVSITHDLFSPRPSLCSSWRSVSMPTPVSFRCQGLVTRQWPTAVRLLSNNLPGNCVTLSRRWESNPPLIRRRCSWTTIGLQIMHWPRFRLRYTSSNVSATQTRLSNRVHRHIPRSRALCCASDLAGSSFYRSVTALSAQLSVPCHPAVWFAEG